MDHCSVEPGDIVFSRNQSAGVGAYVANEEPFVLGQDTVLIKPKDYDARYLYLCMQSDLFRRQMFKLSGGSTFSRINLKELKRFKVRGPTRSEQRKIACILSTWDKAIATVEKLIENSKAQKKALMQQLLTGKRRMAGFIKTRGYFETKYCCLPSDWNFIQIGDVAREVNSRNGGRSNLPVLACSKYEGFVDSLKYFKKKVFSSDTSNYKIVAFGTFGFPSNHIEEGSIGYQNLYDTGLVSPIYTVFQTTSAVHDGYLYKVLKTEHYRQIFAASTNASVDRRGSLRWREFSKIQVPLPPLEEQKVISDAIDQADKELANYLSQFANIKEQKKALMQQLLTGKRRVKIDAI